MIEIKAGDFCSDFFVEKRKVGKNCYSYGFKRQWTFGNNELVFRNFEIGKKWFMVGVSKRNAVDRKVRFELNVKSY